jgi:uncharacterized membrane protein
MVYLGGSLVIAATLSRLEHTYFLSYYNDIAVDAVLAWLSAIATGMMSLTAVVFSIAYITVQFNAMAYSPRIALWFARDPRMFHTLGIFIATFIQALGVMLWIDRGGSGGVPLVSLSSVAVLLIVSMFSFSRLIRGVSDLQVTSTLQQIGEAGREVIRRTFKRVDEMSLAERQTGMEATESSQLGPVVQTLRYSGKPRTVARLDIDELVRQAEDAGGVIEMACAVGDTLVDGTLLLEIRGATRHLSEKELIGAIHLSSERTFEQDPKYPIRLLVDIAIKALSPAINDPTTAVQAIDQIEDLLRRLGRRDLDAGYARDLTGRLRLIFPMPTWEDYLRLSFDEIRQYGGTSIQVVRRLRAALVGVADAAVGTIRTTAVEQYLKQLDLVIERSLFDAEDRAVASQEDRQGLGLSRKRVQTKLHVIDPAGVTQPQLRTEAHPQIPA